MDNYERRFILDRVKDGDTVVVSRIDHGHHLSAMDQIALRLYAVDTPEKDDPATKAAALAAMEFTTAWLNEHLHGGKWLVMKTYQVTNKWGELVLMDSFGRYIAEVKCTQEHSLNRALLESGHAVPFRA
jgi:endonuclease YncB( thermonuclease family)